MEYTGNYGEMWEDFAHRKAHSYLNDKYDLRNIVGLVGRAREHEIVRALQLESTDSILDIGCASGYQVFTIAPFITKGVGVDIAKSFIDAANAFAKKNNITNTEFFHVDAEKLPFADNSFTKIICSEVIEHLVDPSVLLSEIKRVLVPGGVAVFTVPNWNSRGTLYKRIMNRFRPFPFTPLTDFSMEGIAAHGDAHVWQFTLQTFNELITANGLHVEYVGGAAFIDGPKIGRIILIINRLAFFRWLTFTLEKLLAKVPLFRIFGRQIILRARR